MKIINKDYILESMKIITKGNVIEREYEEGVAGTDLKRKSDPLKEYLSEEPMTPAKIITHEPTAVHRDPIDQHITIPGHTGTDTEQAIEQYRRHGMTKIEC